MASVNKVILVGNLGKDPECKYSQNDPSMAITRFTLATSERRGSGEERTEWHNIVCFGRLAEIANEYLSKGRQVYIEGRLQYRSWDDAQSGQKRYMTEILANTLQMLGRREGSEGGYSAPAPRSAPAPQQQKYEKQPQRQAPKDDPFAGDFGPPPSDDDIPF